MGTNGWPITTTTTRQPTTREESRVAAGVSSFRGTDGWYRGPSLFVFFFYFFLSVTLVSGTPPCSSSYDDDDCGLWRWPHHHHLTSGGNAVPFFRFFFNISWRLLSNHWGVHHQEFHPPLPSVGEQRAIGSAAVASIVTLSSPFFLVFFLGWKRETKKFEWRGGGAARSDVATTVGSTSSPESDGRRVYPGDRP